MLKTDDYILKICSVGSYRVGKTSLIRRYAENKFHSNYMPTLGVDVTVKRLTVDDHRVRLVLMDTAGQEQFGKLRTVYFEGSAGCIAVYDITRRETFTDLDRWIQEYKKIAGKDSHIVVIGNKIDLVDIRDVTPEEGRKYALDKNYPFYECSAKLGGDVIPEIYIQLIRQRLAFIHES